ncbi:hypothetical protein [Flaviaesturariibacter amylovorans]|uniref:Uncharacterized protein n=1 Tax=Flaviaesturariibacter amylovorans TaxID=1084520 RepID=A0ABP8GKG4_9BACT
MTALKYPHLTVVRKEPKLQPDQATIQLHFNLLMEMRRKYHRKNEVLYDKLGFGALFDRIVAIEDVYDMKVTYTKFR